MNEADTRQFDNESFTIEAVPFRTKRRRGHSPRCAGSAVGRDRPSAEGAVVDTPDLVAAVRGELVGYKVPKLVIKIDDLGRQPNGKLDYRAMLGIAQNAIRAV
jgi:acyl-CoA synthetase (AMP-forming)/AMP-acid ligase II